MATTPIISVSELSRIANLAYSGKILQARLAYDPGNSLTANDDVSTWETLELPEFTDGYSRNAKLISNANSDPATVSVDFNSIDFGFTANGGSLTYNTVFLVIGSLAESGFTITNVERVGNGAIFTTAEAHDFIATDEVYITGTSTGFDGQYTVLSAPDSTTFTAISTGADVASTADTGTVKKLIMGTELYGIITENPSIVLANAQTQTYRISVSLDD